MAAKVISGVKYRSVMKAKKPIACGEMKMAAKASKPAWHRAMAAARR
jgi:hypothetical protein